MRDFIKLSVKSTFYNSVFARVFACARIDDENDSSGVVMTNKEITSLLTPVSGCFSPSGI